MTGKGNILSPNEVNQSYVRTINTLLITIYIFIYAHLNSSQLITNYSLYPVKAYETELS